MAEGRAHFQRGDFALAHDRFRAALAADPGHPTALFNAALAARKGGLLVPARAAYVELLAAHPEDLDVVWGLAEVERGLGHVDAARALYARIVGEEQRPGRDELLDRARAVLRELAVPSLPSSPSSLSLPGVDSASVATAPAPRAAPATPPGGRAASSAAPSLPSLGDALAATALLEAADRLRAIDADGAGLLAARAQAVELASAAAPPAVLRSLAVARCPVDEDVARGERALAAGAVGEALAAFRRAHACDAARPEPLWGLSRAFDASGDRAQGRRLAARYVAACEAAARCAVGGGGASSRARLRIELPDP